MTRTDNNITLANVDFSLKADKNIQKKNMAKLSTTGEHFFSVHKRLW